jgi:hypothetical protein
LAVNYTFSQVDRVNPSSNIFHFDQKFSGFAKKNLSFNLVNATDFLLNTNLMHPNLKAHYFCCNESWQPMYANWTACLQNFTYYKQLTYNDSNDCGTKGLLPLSNGTFFGYYCVPDLQISGLVPANNSVLTQVFNDFSFSVNLPSNCSVSVAQAASLSFFNVSGSVAVGTYTFGNGTTANWTISCVDDFNATASSFARFRVVLPFGGQAMKLGTCPDTVAGVLVLWLLVAIALFFVVLGFTKLIGLVGLFGALMLFITSWYLVGCASLFAYVLGAIAIFLMPVFAIFVPWMKMKEQG